MMLSSIQHGAQMKTKHIWTVQDLASFLGKSPGAVYVALSRHEEGNNLPKGFRIGRRRYWIPSQVETWLASQTESAPDDPDTKSSHFCEMPYE